MADSSSVIEREYKYRTGANTMALLGGLMIVLGPLTAWIATQNDLGPMKLSSRASRYWFTFNVTAQQAPYALGILALLLAGVGVWMLRFSLRSGKALRRVAFTPTTFIFPDESTGTEKELEYWKISSISLHDTKGPRVLQFYCPGMTQIGSGGLASAQDFDEIHALLTERVNKAVSARQHPSASPAAR